MSAEDGQAGTIAAHRWERDAHNWYVEPAWCSRRLFEAERFEGDVVDPCAGGGNVIRGGTEAGVKVRGFDLVDRGFPGVVGGRDFFAYDWRPGSWPVDCIVSNPPYGRRPAPVLDGERRRWEEAFVELALQRARSKVAVFLDAKWVNSVSRGTWLQNLPLHRVYKVGPRPSVPPGHVAYGEATSTGNGKTDFAWYVFLRNFDGEPVLRWLRRDA